MQQTKKMFKPRDSTFCYECMKWKKDRDTVDKSMHGCGTCSEPDIQNILGTPTTFGSNYCWMGSRKGES